MKNIFVIIFILILFCQSYSQQWTNKFNYTGNCVYEEAGFVLTDASANVYVVGGSATGSKYPATYDNDIQVYKYNSAGTLQWSLTYSGTAGAKDTATSAVIDASGNIYITGCTTKAGNDSTQILILKINSSGQIVAQKILQSGNGTNDIGNSIFVDANGNYYVTGVLNSYITLFKYNSASVLVFGTSYPDLPGTGNSIYVDAGGNIYITGSYTPVSNVNADDLITLKFNSTGTQLWNAKLTVTSTNDYGLKVLADANGNVFVAANNDNTQGRIIKYNSSGTLVANSLASNSTDITDMVLDSFGDVFLCGNQVGNGIVRVYTNSLSLIWSALADDPNQTIMFRAMVIDASLNVYLTGSLANTTYTTMFNSSGVKQWSVTYNLNPLYHAYSNDIALDNSGNPIIAGIVLNSGTLEDFLLIKYTGAGSTHWFRTNNRTCSFDEFITASKMDNSGNYYTSGVIEQSVSLAGNPKGFGVVEKINSSGALVWSYIDSTLNDNNRYDISYNDIAVDNAGNVYITGTANSKCITTKFNSAGSLLWSNYFDPASSGENAGSSIAVDALGNVFVCATAYQSAATLQDIATIKYNSSGVLQWSKFYSGAGAKNDAALKIKIDAAGNIITSGIFYSNVSALNDIVVVKYNQAGTQQWADVIAGTGSGNDKVSDIITDNSNNIYVTGTLVQSGSNSDLFAAKIAANGSILWNSTYNSGGIRTDAGLSLCVDKNSEVYCTGYTVASVTNQDILTVKFNSAGLLQWGQQLVNPAGGINSANSVSADTSGNIFLTGKYLNGNYYNIIAARYNSSGSLMIKLFYTGTGGDCEGIAGFLNSTGDYMIGGNAYEYPQKQNMELLSFAKSSFAIQMKITAGIEGLWNGAAQTRDSVMVYLRISAAPYDKVDSALAYLNTTCDDTVSFFAAPTADYYVSVSHRNSLETWSTGTQSLSPGSYYIQDFTSGQSAAYGNNLIFYNNKWCIYSGDINKDGFINGNDFTFFSTQFGQSGYLPSDINNDGVVNGNDFTLYSSSFGKISVHP